MKDLNSIKSDIAQMSKVCLKMVETAHEAFMEHDSDLIGKALENEQQLNDMEKSITTDLVDIGRSCARKEERLKAALYADVAGDLELIGDYCKDILERVQIKIDEKLLFSEEGVKEYNDLYNKTENALKEIVNALDLDNLALVKEVLKGEQHIDSLVDEYRRRHSQRIIDGACTPMSCNMFLNMLDFTAAIYYHAKKVARSLLKIKS